MRLVIDQPDSEEGEEEDVERLKVDDLLKWFYRP